MNDDLGIFFDRTAAEEQIQGLSERVAELEAENQLLENVLRRNTRMFEAFLSNCHDGITLTGPDRRIVRVIKGLTGIDPTSLSGQLIDSLAVPEDRQTIVNAYRQLLEGGCSRVQIVVRVPRKDGTLVVHSATLTDMLDDTDVQGIVWNYSAEISPWKTT
jgi:PAS domain S-box-containing protein